MLTDLVSLTEVRAAARRLAGITIRTPLIPLAGLAGSSLALGPGQGRGLRPGARPLLIKPESLQPTGAFKLRGAYNAISVLIADAAAQERPRPAGVVAHSSGNHGFAVAYAAAALGVPAAIVVPETAPKVKTEAIVGTGAELVTVAPTMAARAEGARRIAVTRGYAEIPPFDDRNVIAGQGTIGLEIAEDMAGADGGPAAILVPVSGGGLIAGIAVAVKALLPGTRVIGVEPELAADARESLHAGTPVAWTAAQTARTRADALRVERVGELTFPHLRKLVDDIVTVTEEEMLAAIRHLAIGARLVAEPGGAVAVAAALFRDPAGLIPAGTSGDSAAPVVAVLSGGNIDPALLAEVLQAESYTG